MIRPHALVEVLPDNVVRQLEQTGCDFFSFGNTMENHRKSKIKKARKSGFRRRMLSKGGRKILAHRRKGLQTK